METTSTDGEYSQSNVVSRKKKKIKFTPVQIARLQALYSAGIRGIGETCLPSITKAAKDTGLEIAQVKRWIKKKHYKTQHDARAKQRYLDFPVKSKPKTHWQIYLKHFGDTEAGKKAMKEGPGAFNKVASDSYKNIDEEDKLKLQEERRGQSSGKRMSVEEAHREGRRLFTKIRSLFKQLELLKYRCLAFGFLEGDVQVVTTKDCVGCATEGCIEYIHALTICENPPKPPNHQSPSPPRKSRRRRTPSLHRSQRQSCSPPSKRPRQSKTPHQAPRHRNARRPSPSLIGMSRRPSPSPVGKTRQKSPLPVCKSRRPSLSPSPVGTTSQKSPSPVCKTRQPSPSPIGKTRLQSPSPRKTSLHRSQRQSCSPPSKRPRQSKTPQQAPRHRNARRPSPSLIGMSRRPSPSPVGKTRQKSPSPVCKTRQPSPSPIGKTCLQSPSPRKQVLPHHKTRPQSPSLPGKACRSPLSPAKTCEPSPSPPNHSHQQLQTFPHLPSSYFRHSTPMSTSNEPKQLSVSPPSPIVIEESSSPTPMTHNVWISSLHLTMEDKAVIQAPDGWLNDSIISAAHMLLQQLSGKEVNGLQSTQLGKKLAFSPVPPYQKVIQILHVDGNHWILVSNIRAMDDSGTSGSVRIYDSLKFSVSLDTKKQICSLLKPQGVQLTLDIMNVQQQTNISDCGLFSIAFATELASHQSPFLCEFDTSLMRSHLLTCFDNGVMKPFPLKKKRRCPFGSKVRKSINVPVYCICRMPNDRSMPMIKCDNCKTWLHYGCEDIDDEDVNGKWMCSTCTELLNATLV